MNNTSSLLLLHFLFLSIVLVPCTSVNITKGSVLSTSPNETRYWLSPSGIFAFGFHSIDYAPDRYIIGIWLEKSSVKPLVWTADPDNCPLSSLSSIILDENGLLKVLYNGTKPKALLGDCVHQSAASYAVMNDNGNFVIWNSNAEVIWQSFDYPTDTIVQGQSLKSGGSLMSLKSEVDGFGQYDQYQLLMQQNGNLVIYYVFGYRNCIWSSDTQGTSSHVALNLNIDGKLYLVDSNGVMIMNLTNDDLDEDAVFWNMDQFGNIGNDSLYRATLGSDGCLYLFKEKIGFGSNRSVLLWQSDKFDDFPFWLFFIIILCLITWFMMFLWCLFPCRNYSTNKSAAGAEC